MASFFALNIAQFRRDANSVLQLDYVVKYMREFFRLATSTKSTNNKLKVLFTTVVAVPFITMAFLINNLVDSLKRMLHRQPKQKEVLQRSGKQETDTRELVLGGGELATKRFNLRWRSLRTTQQKSHVEVV